MDYSTLFKSYTWREEEAAAIPYIIDHFKFCHLDSYRAYHIELATVLVYYFKGKYVYEWPTIEEGRKGVEWALEKIKKNKTFFNHKKTRFAMVERLIRQVSDFIRPSIHTMTNAELEDFITRVYEFGRESYGYAIITESTDALTDEDYTRVLHNVEQRHHHEIIQTLTTPSEGSFLEEEHVDLLELAAQAFSYENLLSAVREKSHERVQEFEEFHNKLFHHAKAYYWIQNSFAGATHLSEEYFLNALSQLVVSSSPEIINAEIAKLTSKHDKLKKIQLRYVKKYALSRDAQNMFLMLRKFSKLQDRRKENSLRLIACMEDTLREVSKRFNISRDDLDFYFVDEVKRLVKSGEKVDEHHLAERKSDMAIISQLVKGETVATVCVGDEARGVFKVFHSQHTIDVSEPMKGFVACKGGGEAKIKGIARLIFDPMEDEFNEGEILVTGMTRPEYAPLMKKAKAIITSEGGITSHAAIISRELNIPCIIGTKIATKVLKDGDEVEIDTTEGIVRIVKKYRAS